MTIGVEADAIDEIRVVANPDKLKQDWLDRRLDFSHRLTCQRSSLGV